MFHLYHHNDLLRLAELLSALLDRNAGGNPLVPDTVIVPNRGVGRWLQIQLAESQGIAANLELPLPARFIWDLLPACMPEEAGSQDFARGRLLWHLYAVLPEAAQDNEPVAAYLRGDTPELMRLQLASQLSDLFDQYLIYRPAMLRRWERPLSGEPVTWQADVWRHLRKRLKHADRSELLDRFIRQLADPALVPDALLPRQVFCIGLEQMPPEYLRFFYALGQRVDVHFLLPNPCDGYWGDIQQKPLSLEADIEADLPADELSLEADHPLLASLGRGTRDLLRVLYSEELTGIQEPELGEAMAYTAPASDSLLADVQTALINMTTENITPRTASDASLQIHACHSPLREVQVLHDQLLDLLGGNPGLQPRDILVITPDMGSYAPAIRSVFGAARGEHFIPWSLSDRSLNASHPIVQAFLRLMDLPLSRWEASEILALAAVPATMRRFRLDAAALDRLTEWTQAAGVRWGFDSETRREFGAGDLSQNSWRFGLDRLLLGLAQNDEQTLTAGVAPWTDLEGGNTTALGGLWFFLDRLRHWRSQLSESRCAADWQDQLNRLVDDLFRVDRDDYAENQGTDAIRSAISGLQDAVDCLGETELLGWVSIREIMNQALAQASANQPFLSAGVTFCGMQPLRGVPFEVICMIGMNDGAFPRPESNRQLNLLRQDARLGDFSPRHDDQLTFLQAINCARSTLYISYIGQDLSTGESLPPAALVDEFMDFLKAFHLEGAASSHDLITRQPMHPFSQRYFRTGEGQRVFTFSSDWLTAAQGALAIRRPALALDDGASLPAAATSLIEITDLIRFFDHPPRHFFQRLLQIRMDAEENEIRDTEPLALGGLEAYMLRDALLQQARDRNAARIDEEPTELWRRTGLLPPPPLGQQAYATEAWCINHLLPIQQGWAALPDQPETVTLDLEIGDYRLVGRVADCWPDGIRRLRVGRWSMKYQLRAMIDYLAWVAAGHSGQLCLAGMKRKTTDGELTVSLEQFEAGANAEQAADYLSKLIEIYLGGQRRPLKFMPGPAELYLDKLEKKNPCEALAAVNDSLLDDYRPLYEASDPYLGALLNPGNAPLGDDPDTSEFCRLSEDIGACLAGLREAEETNS